jgi:hypothetical protein
MANNPLLTFMQGFTWTSLTDKFRHPGAPAKFDESRRAQESLNDPDLQAAPLNPYNSDSNSNRRTIRVGKEIVEIDVEAMKQFVEKVKETHSSAA